MNNVSGIEAGYGGSCICEICHAYCDEFDEDVLKVMSAEEDNMLDMVSGERRPHQLPFMPNSRQRKFARHCVSSA